MDLIAYTKLHATAADRVAHLRAVGLVIAQPHLAAKKIDLIGYERLRIYFHSRRQNHLPQRPFVLGTTYQQILELYKCDELLRNAIFPVVGQFEILFRNSISEALSDSFGSHPYNDVAAFKDATANLRALQSFVGIFQRIKDRRAAHYRQKYETPALPPI